MNLKVARQPPDGTLAAPAPPQNKHTKDEHKRTRTHRPPRSCAEELLTPIIIINRHSLSKQTREKAKETMKVRFWCELGERAQQTNKCIHGICGDEFCEFTGRDNDRNTQRHLSRHPSRGKPTQPNKTTTDLAVQGGRST